MFTIKHSNTNYLSHMLTALAFSMRCAGWSLRSGIHAVLPGLFPDTSVRMVAFICKNEEEVEFTESLRDA